MTKDEALKKTIIELREEAIKEDKNPEFYLYQKLEEKDKEIEILNKECDTYMKIATKKDNIINELERYIRKNIEAANSAIAFNIDVTKDEHEALKYGRDVNLFEMILDKLKELKEKSDI